MKSKNLKVFGTISIISIFLFLSYSSGESDENKDESSETEASIRTSFKDGDDLFEYVSFGYYGYSDLVEQWGEAEVGRPYLNDRNDGFNVKVTWKTVKVNGYEPVFEFSVSDSDGETPVSFKGVSVNDYVFEY